MVGMMGWEAPKQSWRKGPWTPEEDKLLAEYVNFHGEGRWSSVARSAGLNRSGKSCRLRWVNYLRPGLKRGHITLQEEVIIVELHRLWGNKWSTIARYLPGRTDNEIKNYWRTRFKKKELSSQKQQKRKAQILKLNQQQHHHQQQQQQQEVEEPQQSGNDQTSAVGDDVKRKSQVTDMSHQEAAAGAAPYWLDQYSLIDEGFLWGGCLGSQLDHPLYQPAANCNKIITLQNQATTYSSFGGDARNVYNAAAGYIF